MATITTVIDSVAVPRSSAVLAARTPVTNCSAVFSALSNRWKFPEVAGLKIIKPNAAVRSVSRARLRATTRRGATLVVCEAQETAVVVPDVTDATWKSLVLGSESPVLVEFWAPWCGPCRMIHPVIDEVAKEYAGKLKCYKLNTDQSPSVATEYGIRSIPTIMIFKNGEKKDAVIGAVPKTTLVTNIEKYL